MNSSYQLILRSMVRTTKSVIELMNKAENYIVSKQIDEQELLSSRLAPDMLPFSKQIQLISDNLKGFVARTTESQNPSMEDNEMTLAELIQRLNKTLTWVETIDFSNVTDEKLANLKVSFRFFPEGMYIDGIEYVEGYAIPNFYFHAVTAYDILRNHGMTIGKQDFLFNLQLKK